MKATPSWLFFAAIKMTDGKSKEAPKPIGKSAKADTFPRAAKPTTQQRQEVTEEVAKGQSW